MTQRSKKLCVYDTCDFFQKFWHLGLLPTCGQYVNNISNWGQFQHIKFVILHCDEPVYPESGQYPTYNTDKDQFYFLILSIEDWPCWKS